MKSIEPMGMVVGEKYLAVNKSTGRHEEFTLYMVSLDGVVYHSLNGSFISGHWQYYTLESDRQWVDIPSDVPVKFKSKVNVGDWYIGWFDPVSGLFRGLSRGDSKVSEHYEEDIEWETL